ncbi:hypothetical protein [Pseudomonas lundensis]|uniref:hypothetical protein n=1 Tax=Pseudomonas lundensis TaxID=86185 RepID=UPI0014835830|nr:hypothetical protein [Pseudomonas lundensis]
MTISKWFLTALLAASGVSGAILNNVISNVNGCSEASEKTVNKFQERPNIRGQSQGF